MTALTKAQRKDLHEQLMKKTDLVGQIWAELKRLGEIARKVLLDKQRKKWDADYGEGTFDTIQALPDNLKCALVCRADYARLSYYDLDLPFPELARQLRDMPDEERHMAGISLTALISLQLPFQPPLWDLYTYIEELDSADLRKNFTGKFDRLTTLVTEWNRVSTTLRKALDGIRTHKQLAEQMPEVVALLPDQVK